MKTGRTKTGLSFHLMAYLSINAMLIWINLELTPQYLWFVWPLLGWGIGLCLHGLVLIMPDQKGNKGFYIHLTVFLFTNALLIFTNLYTSPEYIWFKFPLVAWSALLIFHKWQASSQANAAY